MVANSSNVKISMAAKLKTEMLDKASASDLDMLHPVICTISLSQQYDDAFEEV